MEENICNELTEIKQLTLLGVKNALTMKDTSLLTGLSMSYLYKLVCAKKIPYYKSKGGKFTYFNKAEIEKWLLCTRIKTIDEIETEAETYCLTGKREGVNNGTTKKSSC